MKKWTVILFALTIVTQGLFAQNGFTIKGTTPSNLNGTTIYLSIFDDYSDRGFRHRDSAVIKNNSFAFSGKIPKVAEFAEIHSKKGGFSFVVDSGANVIVVNEVKDGPHEFSNSIIINSDNNFIYRKLDSLSRQYYSAKAGKSLDRTESQQLYTDQLTILRAYPKSMVSLLYTYLTATTGTMQQRLDVPLEAYKTLSDDLKQSPLGLEFYNKISQRFNSFNSVKPGSKIHEFSVQTHNGKSFNNEQLSGRPYIIAFSATWCMPCQIYLREFKALYDKYKAKGVEVVYFNLDDNTKKWTEHIDKNKLTWINVSEKTKMASSEIAKMFHIYAVPTYILIDKFGVIVYNSAVEAINFQVMESRLKEHL
jgi:peroxiredoxin